MLDQKGTTDCPLLGPLLTWSSRRFTLLLSNRSRRRCVAHPPRWRCRSANSVIACVAERGRPVGRTGLGEDTVDVALDRVRTEVEGCGNLRVGPAPGHQGQDLCFPLREAVREELGK